MSTLSTLVDTASARQEIKRSRFVAVAGSVSDETAAKAFIAENSDLTANHNCWVWRLGTVYRFSDDGEPGGTAGKPILQAIEGQSLDRVAVVVTRWFGGTLLGSGGLIRAYGGTAAMCLREAVKVPLVETISAAVICAFGDLSLVQSRLDAVPGAEAGVHSFTDTGAVLSVSVPKDKAEAVFAMVTDLTSGRATIKFCE